MQNDMRDKLVELLQEYTDNNNGGGSNHGRADHLIANGVIVPQWISVEDRLPEEKQEVLTIDSENKMEVCFYEKKWKGIFQQCGGLVKIFNITHWMPLPKPPKAEQKLKELSGNGNL